MTRPCNNLVLPWRLVPLYDETVKHIVGKQWVRVVYVEAPMPRKGFGVVAWPTIKDGPKVPA